MRSDHSIAGKGVGRRTILKLGAAGLLATELDLIGGLATAPARVALADSQPVLPSIQFDIQSFTPPARTIDGVAFRFPPVFTFFLTATLSRTPTKRDQAVLANALDEIEERYPFSPKGIFTLVSYGIPYFSRLPGGMTGSLVSGSIPHIPLFPNRLALEEAVPAPTDVSPRNPTITKQTFNVPVQIESNDVLFTLRSDSLENLRQVAGWLAGAGVLGHRLVPSPKFDGLFRFNPPRLSFVQPGMPRRIAEHARLPFARQINSRSPMWMGFADQQVDGTGPAAIATFLGNGSSDSRLANPGDYFALGAIQHLSHVIEDLGQFYRLPSGTDPGEPYVERVQYMFRSNAQGTADGLPSDGKPDQFADGGGPAYLDNVFQGVFDADANAAGMGTFGGQHRLGHVTALQRESREQDGTPAHVRMDGPGFDSLDVPDGTPQPKLHFTMFVHSAILFQIIRQAQSSHDLAVMNQVPDEHNGIERFTTTTRRQNFLIPPREHRAFPLLELT